MQKDLHWNLWVKNEYPISVPQPRNPAGAGEYPTDEVKAEYKRQSLRFRSARPGVKAVFYLGYWPFLVGYWIFNFKFISPLLFIDY